MVWYSSICLSVRSLVHLSVPVAAGLMLWARWTGNINRLLHGQLSAEAADECGQCHLVSMSRKLNTDLLYSIAMVWLLIISKNTCC